MKENQKIFESGKFFTGCNYWASHAGTNMWHDWSEETVESDLKRLSEANIKVMRMFPLWSDFQPLRMHYQGGGNPMELRLREDPLPHTPEGRAGLDPVMLDRFETFLDLAKKYGIKLIVGLITGWMSGRMFMPEAFAGRGLLTDPMVITWQTKFVRYMVKRFKDHPAISAWDLGNECNCMQGGISRDSANVWASHIAGAIKLEDTTHPVVSGMHSILPNGTWTPEDQAECLDILCTHPYPIFTPHCDTDPINEMKTVLHSTAETVMYESIGNIPAFIEEAGTLGPMIAEERIAGDYVRAAMFSAWAHDLRGFVWWCANEQSALRHTPYDWNSVERELGLFRIDGSKKPVLEEMTAFTNFVDSFEFETLPKRLTDAVCILSEGQDVWAAAYGSFILAKQAGLDITFAWQNDLIPEAPAYIIPSVGGDRGPRLHVMLDLIERVKKGAKLYLSINDALLSPFAPLTGVKVSTRSRRVREDVVNFAGNDFHFWTNFKLKLESIGAEVIAADSNGQPAFTKYKLGDGEVYFSAFPIEIDASCKNGVISGDNAVPYYSFYKALGFRNPEKIASSSSPYIGITEHKFSDRNGRLLLILNHTPEARSANIELSSGKFERYINVSGGECKACDGGFEVELPGNTGIIAVISE